MIPHATCFLEEWQNYFQADLFCKENGGELMEPRSQSEMDKIGPLLTDDGKYWIGLTDLANENNDFRWWSNGDVPDFTPWYEPNGEPTGDDGHGHTESCVEISTKIYDYIGMILIALLLNDLPHAKS